jgi:hypothetical protein
VVDKHPLSLFLVVLLQRKISFFFRTKPKKYIKKIIFFLHMDKNPKVILAFLKKIYKIF